MLRITRLEADRRRGCAFLIASTEAILTRPEATFVKIEGIQFSLFNSVQTEAL
jgi:hypothetical protein